MEESFGATGTLLRETKGEVVLVSRLRAALERLNPTLPPEAITAAVDELTRDRSAMSLEAAELDPEQEARLERELSRQHHILIRDDRLETVAQDMVRHSLRRGFVGKEQSPLSGSDGASSAIQPQPFLAAPKR